MQCEVCGSEFAKKRAIVSGSELVVCDTCVKYGRELPSGPKIVVHPVERYSKEAIPAEKELKENYGSIIRAARESRGMTIEDFAKMLFVNHSWIRKVESGHQKPDEKLIAKLEKALSIKLTGE